MRRPVGLLLVLGIGSLLSAQAPQISGGGIVNAASFQPHVAPGALVTIFGANLAPSAQKAPSLPLPTQINGVQVLVSGTPMQLLYVSPTQINYWHRLPPGSPLVVKNGNSESEPQTPPASATAPGIFTISQDGRGQGAVLHGNTADLADSQHPARAGDALEIYLTGLEVQVGRPTVTIGGVAAEVLFVGNAPGFVGLNQVNVRVPPGVVPGDTVLLQLAHFEVPANAVTISVR